MQDVNDNAGGLTHVHQSSTLRLAKLLVGQPFLNEHAVVLEYLSCAPTVAGNCEKN